MGCAAAREWTGSRLRFGCVSGTGILRARPPEVFGVWHSGARVCADLVLSCELRPPWKEGGCARNIFAVGGALRTEVIGWLRLGHAKRRPRARGADRRGKISDMVRIHDRPPEVAERVVPGHWEGDLIKGAYNRSAVGTLVERATLFTVLAKLDNASAASVAKVFGQVLPRIAAQKRLSLT